MYFDSITTNTSQVHVATDGLIESTALNVSAWVLIYDDASQNLIIIQMRLICERRDSVKPKVYE